MEWKGQPRRASGLPGDNAGRRAAAIYGGPRRAATRSPRFAPRLRTAPGSLAAEFAVDNVTQASPGKENKMEGAPACVVVHRAQCARGGNGGYIRPWWGDFGRVYWKKELGVDVTLMGRKRGEMQGCCPQPNPQKYPESPDGRPIKNRSPFKN